MFLCLVFSHVFTSVHCCLVVTCWERADLFALVGNAYCIFVTFPCDILGQVWYLIVSFLIFATFLTSFGSIIHHSYISFNNLIFINKIKTYSTSAFSWDIGKQYRHRSDTAFYQGLHCLLRQNRSSEKENKIF